MVRLSSLPKAQQEQFRLHMYMASRPRWDASTPAVGGQSSAAASPLDGATSYIEFQRSQREPLFQGTANQPVGGRMARQHKMQNQNNEWTETEEAAFQKAFGKPSNRP